MWRKPAELPVPPELLDPDPRLWPTLEVWSQARFEWLLQHPDRTIDGMDVVEIIYELD
jgi:hypothetical protein